MLWCEDDSGDHRRSAAEAEAASYAPPQLVSPRQRLMVEKVKVEGVAQLREVGLIPAGPIIVDLQLEIRAVFENMAPLAEQIPSRKLAILLNNGRGDRGSGRDGNALPDGALVKIALKRQRVGTLQFPVHPETALSHLPAVEVLAIRMKRGASVESFSIHTIIKVRAVSAPIAEIEEALFISTAGGDQPTAGVLRFLGDDIDHAVDGVRSPDGCARTTDDFDPVHILHQRILN